jgi:hypothetical protein
MARPLGGTVEVDVQVEIAIQRPASIVAASNAGKLMVMTDSGRPR